MTTISCRAMSRAKAFSHARSGVHQSESGPSHQLLSLVCILLAMCSVPGASLAVSDTRKTPQACGATPLRGVLRHSEPVQYTDVYLAPVRNSSTDRIPVPTRGMGSAVLKPFRLVDKSALFHYQNRVICCVFIRHYFARRRTFLCGASHQQKGRSSSMFSSCGRPYVSSRASAASQG